MSLKKKSITIVIPTLNEVNYIRKTLESIVNNDIPINDYEVIMVDGGSTDGTVNAASSFNITMPLRIIEAPGTSVYTALNVGLNESLGEYFVRVDARSIIPNNYICTCISHLNLENIQCAGGIQFQYGNNPISKSIAEVLSSTIGTGGAKFRMGKESGFVDSVYLGVYRTSILRQLGGFDDSSDFVSEDALINKRIRDKGGKVYLDSSLKVLYPAKSSFRALIKQYFIYGAAKAFVLRKYKTLTSIRQTIPLVFFASLLALIILSCTRVIPSFVLAAFMLLYLATVVVFCLRGEIANDESGGRFAYRVLAVLCIHFSWILAFVIFIFSPFVHKRIAELL